MLNDQTVTEASSGSAGSADISPSSEAERIKGLQRAVSEKARAAEEAQRINAALQARIEALELGQMSESDRESVLTQREKAQFVALQQENERLKLAQKYPQIAPHYEALLKARTAEEQAVYLDRILNPPKSDAAPAANDDFSDTDPNNPMRLPNDPIGLPPGENMDEATADRILKAWGNRPLRGR